MSTFQALEYVKNGLSFHSLKSTASIINSRIPLWLERPSQEGHVCIMQQQKLFLFPVYVLSTHVKVGLRLWRWVGHETVVSNTVNLPKRARAKPRGSDLPRSGDWPCRLKRKHVEVKTLHFCKACAHILKDSRFSVWWRLPRQIEILSQRQKLRPVD